MRIALGSHPAGSLRGCAACAIAVLVSHHARAQVADATTSDPPRAVPATTGSAPRDELEYRTERRGGFVLGVIAGPAIGWAAGNPSDIKVRSDPAVEAETGVAFGHRVTPLLGGALSDWFTFGVGATFGSLQNGDYRSGIGSFIFHLEAFPLYGEADAYRDIGVSVDFGAGSSAIRTKSPDDEVASSGVMSTVGVGVFWEPLRVWHLAAGPYVGYQHNWSRWYTRNDLTLGLRAMFYGAP